MAGDAVSGSSDGLERTPRPCGMLHDDRVSGVDVTAGDDDAHDSCLADEAAAIVAREGCRHQAGPDAVELDAWIPESRHLDHGVGAQAKPGPGRQPEQVDAARGDVLPHLAGRQRESGRTELVVELGVDQVDLAEIRRLGILPQPRAVLDGRTEMSIALDTQAAQQRDPIPRPLLDRVALAQAHRRYDPVRAIALHSSCLSQARPAGEPDGAGPRAATLKGKGETLLAAGGFPGETGPS